jgi:glycolate oxidase iron-sulfur subunit
MLTVPVIQTALCIAEEIGLKGLMRVLLGGRLGEIAQLAPSAEPPLFFSHVGKTVPAQGSRRHRVAFLAGCIANVSFARLNEATARVLQKNGCEVAIPADQGCCGALHLTADCARMRNGWRAAISTRWRTAATTRS